MLRSLVLSCLLLLLVVPALSGCAKSGATKEEKDAALAAAKAVATADVEIGPKILTLEESHGKMTVIIDVGTHPQKQSDFIQKVGIDWYNAYPEGKRPTKNDMVQVYLYETDQSKDDLGFIQVWTDEYGKMTINFHHYLTQPVM